MGHSLPLIRKWVFSGTDTSASAYHRFAIVAVETPAMEATTVELQLQKSNDPPEVADADATWLPVNEAGEQVTIKATTAVGDEQLDPAMKLEMKRTRVKAVDSGGTGVNQVAQIVKPVCMPL